MRLSESRFRSAYVLQGVAERGRAGTNVELNMHAHHELYMRQMQLMTVSGQRSYGRVTSWRRPCLRDSSNSCWASPVAARPIDAASIDRQWRRRRDTADTSATITAPVHTPILPHPPLPPFAKAASTAKDRIHVFPDCTCCSGARCNMLHQKAGHILYVQEMTGVRSRSTSQQSVLMLPVAQAPSPSRTSVLPQVRECKAAMSS